MQRLKLRLRIGELGFGLLNVIWLGLARGIVGYLGLLHCRFGTVHRSLGLNIRIVILLALGIIQAVGNGFALCIGARWAYRVVAGILHILPIL